MLGKTLPLSLREAGTRGSLHLPRASAYLACTFVIDVPPHAKATVLLGAKAKKTPGILRMLSR